MSGLAGLAVGYWKSQADIARQWQVDARFTSTMKPVVRKKNGGWVGEGAGEGEEVGECMTSWRVVQFALNHDSLTGPVLRRHFSHRPAE